MSMDYKKQILTTLLDWYETSAAYTRGESPTRRQIMRLYENGSSDFPAYNIENHIVRKDINEAIQELSRMGLVSFEWMRGQTGHIIAQVWLCFDKLADTYSYLNRQPKNLEVEEAISQLTQIIQSSVGQWAKEWAHEKLEEITRKRSIGRSLPENRAERDDLMRAILQLDRQKETEILERIFSIRCFGDSKRFERTVRKRLIGILKKYLAQEDDCADDAVLHLVGLVRAPEQFEFSGAITLVFSGGEIDFSLLPYGGIITSDDVNAGTFRCATNIKSVISIENKSNYIDYVRKSRSPDELVIYHGGQYSPAKQVFLQRLYAALPCNCSFFHWGDIDYGGFSMLSRLRREIIPHVLPLKMGIAELMQYQSYCAEFKKPYAEKLSTLLHIPELSDCTDCIEYMLKHSIRLEQEAMLT